MKRGTQVITDYLRCPDDMFQIETTKEISGHPGFFNFGSDIICYGKCSAFSPSRTLGPTLQDALEHTQVNRGAVSLPFQLSEVVETLRQETYMAAMGPNGGYGWTYPFFRASY